MAVPAHRRTNNIQLSVQAQIGDSLGPIATVTPAGVPLVLTVPVHHNAPFADPDEVRDPGGTPARAWVQTTWLQSLAGRHGKSILQVDVYSVVGAPGGAAGDTFGVIANDIADEVDDIFSGPRGGGDTALRAEIRINDYANPLAPVPTDVCLLCSPSGTGVGSFGSPAERTPARQDGDFWRITFTYEFSTVLDQPWLSHRFGA